MRAGSATEAHLSGLPVKGNPAFGGLLILERRDGVDAELLKGDGLELGLGRGGGLVVALRVTRISMHRKDTCRRAAYRLEAVEGGERSADSSGVGRMQRVDLEVLRVSGLEGVGGDGGLFTGAEAGQPALRFGKGVEASSPTCAKPPSGHSLQPRLPSE